MHTQMAFGKIQPCGDVSQRVNCKMDKSAGLKMLVGELRTVSNVRVRFSMVTVCRNIASD